MFLDFKAAGTEILQAADVNLGKPYYISLVNTVMFNKALETKFSGFLIYTRFAEGAEPLALYKAEFL